MNLYRLTTFLLTAALLLCGSGLSGKMLEIKGRQTLDVDSPLTYGKKGFISNRSRQQFLSVNRDNPFSLPRKINAAETVDTIDIVALRVDFVREVTDDPLTTGWGVFDVERDTAQFIAEEGHGWDPAPHNRHYFEAHLRSMKKYWETVSGGRLVLEYTVWPAGSDSAYHLDSQMSYYGYRPPDFGLGDLFHDAINTAFSKDSMLFHDTLSGRKKAVMIFHAGADQQTNLGAVGIGVDTPYDLYTAFLVFTDSNRVFVNPIDSIFASPFDSLVIDTVITFYRDTTINYRDTVSEGIIMPETMSQDNRVTVMNAVIAHEFGHQLGLVDLYSTRTFMTQLGDFALMDNNGMNTATISTAYDARAFGAVPLYASAWSRAYLGFEEVHVFDDTTSIQLAAVKMRSDSILPKIAKIPISSTEYYLLENRRTWFGETSLGLRQDSSSNVILWPAKAGPFGSPPIFLPEYDANLPEGTSGIAVWHIDEMVAMLKYNPFAFFDNNFENNTLQWDRHRRFISLVEADGVINFGGNYHSGYGKMRDLFYLGNNGQLSSYTNPPSLSNDGGYTHIKISNISAPDSIMTFDVAPDMTSRHYLADNFPRRISIPANPTFSPIAADIDGSGEKVMLAVSDNKIFAIDILGRDYIDPLDTIADIDTIYSPINLGTDAGLDLPQMLGTASMPLFAEVGVGELISFGPVTASINDTSLVFVGTDKGSVYAFAAYDTTEDSGHDGRAQLIWISKLPFEINHIFPDAERGLVFCFMVQGAIAVYNWDGTQAGLVLFPGDLIRGACRYGDGFAMLSEDDDQTILYMLKDVPLAYQSVHDSVVVDSVIIDELGFHPPIATDFNRDQNDEMIIVSISGHVLAYTFDSAGIDSDNPYFDFNTDDLTLGGPVVGDFTGDGYPELIITGTNRVFGYDRNGLMALDFPIIIDRGRPEQAVITTPIISDINGDGAPDIVVAALDSILNDESKFVCWINYANDPPDTTCETVTYYYYNYYTNFYAVTPGMPHVNGFPIPAGAYGIRQPGQLGSVIGVGSPAHFSTGGGNGLLVSSGGDGWLYAWMCGWSDNKDFWPMAGRTPDGAGYLSPGTELGPVSSLAQFLPEERFFNYPNPAEGTETTILYYVNEGARISITIFDAIGDVVWETEGISEGNQNNEIVWNLDDVASGIYHCRLEATSMVSSQRAVAYKTIAVVK